MGFVPVAFYVLRSLGCTGDSVFVLVNSCVCGEILRFSVVCSVYWPKCLGILRSVVTS